MSQVYIARRVFEAIGNLIVNDKVPVNLRPHSTTGTVQDDPFDEWFGETLEKHLPEFEVVHSGPLTTPDIILRDRKTCEIIGIEVKKVDEQKTGKDSRGLTLDYNSCIPCGRMQIKIGNNLSTIKTYYFFGLLSFDQTHLVSSCLMDGDFLNYDFELHLQGKYLNTSQYGHGPYGEGSVRGRAMYNYPNPMNTELQNFYKKHSLIVNNEYCYQLEDSSLSVFAEIERKSIDGNIFLYSQFVTDDVTSMDHISDIFKKCKARKSKKRTAYITEISECPAPYNPKVSKSII